MKNHEDDADDSPETHRDGNLIAMNVEYLKSDRRGENQRMQKQCGKYLALEKIPPLFPNLTKTCNFLWKTVKSSKGLMAVARDLAPTHTILLTYTFIFCTQLYQSTHENRKKFLDFCFNSNRTFVDSEKSVGQ